MTCIFAARDRVQAADGLPVVLDAAYAAFEEMLAVIQAHQDPGEAMFIPFVMAATCAASGRDAVLFAPSLPSHPLQRAPTPAAGEWRPGGTLAAARELAGLCEAVETKLTRAAGTASGQRDRSACLDAAAAARGLREYLSGSVP
jgi:hypothetical protein